MSNTISRYLAPLFLVLSICLGGGSAAGYLANGALQLTALAIIVTLVLLDAVPELSPQAQRLLIIVGAGAAVLAAQLIPLPPFLWSILPGRGEALNGYRMLGEAAPWLPISLAPQRTIAALLSLLPAVTMILLVFASSGYGRLYSIYALVGTAIVSIMLGVFQHLQGPDSLYYIYDITNLGGVVGFFANRNHLSTLLLTSLPFVAALAVTPSRRADADRKIGRRMITGCLILFITVGTIVVKSVAGWMLLLPTLVACLLIYRRGESGKLSGGAIQAVLATTVIGVVLALFAPIQLNDLGDKLSGLGPDERNQSISTTLRAAADYLPFGSGAGSFQLIYPQYEQPADADAEYVNHAHSDYAEVALEYGVPGALLIAWMLVWWLGNFAQVWRKNSIPGTFGRAGFISIGVIAAHSVVDYPLRTAAIAAVAGMAAALMVAPESDEAPSGQFRRRKRRASTRAITLGERAEVAGPPRT